MQTDPNLPWYRKLHWQVLMAMVLGGLTGAVFGGPAAERLGWIGDLFMRLLRMIIVPLVLTSIISGVASVGGGRTIGRLFTKTLGYYVMSSFLAIIVGLTMVNLIGPGRNANMTGEVGELPDLQTPSSPVDLLLSVVPENFIQAVASSDMLAIIFFSIVFGASVTVLPEATRKTVTDLVDALFHAMMVLTGGIIRFLPIGVFALITRMVGTTGFDAFRPLVLYAVTLASGLTVHLVVTLPLLLIVLGKISPRVHFANMREALLVAFSTSSSGATLPGTINAVETKVGVSNRISSFVLPMGATVNMDGTALFECMGALFVAQALGFELGVGPAGDRCHHRAVGVDWGCCGSLRRACSHIYRAGGGRPAGAGGERDRRLHARPLDMYRTVVNIFSDSCGAVIIARSEGETDVDTEVR